MAISIQNATARTSRQIWTKDVWKRAMLRTDVCIFPPNIFAPTPKISPKPHFSGPFNAKPIIQIAVRKSHVNGTTKVKLYSYIGGIGKYLGCVSNFFAWGRPGGAWPLKVNLGPPVISETTGARKFKLKTKLHMVKYSGYKIVFR